MNTTEIDILTKRLQQLVIEQDKLVIEHRQIIKDLHRLTETTTTETPAARPIARPIVVGDYVRILTRGLNIEQTATVNKIGRRVSLTTPNGTKTTRNIENIELFSPEEH
jgi:hypothetical protein